MQANTLQRKGTLPTYNRKKEAALNLAKKLAKKDMEPHEDLASLKLKAQNTMHRNEMDQAEIIRRSLYRVKSHEKVQKVFRD